jgi:hypothetical protein
MALNFPNQSRSYDERGQRIRFWGYDGAFEISFFLEQHAFSRISPDAKSNEAGFLRAFDQFRDRILQVAAKVYAGRRRDAYTLHAADF